MTAAIRAEGLVKNFGKTQALAGAAWPRSAGTVLGVLGPNGAGKTTAVRILTTLLLPDGGRAEVGGYDVVTDAHQVRQLIGLTGSVRLGRRRPDRHQQPDHDRPPAGAEPAGAGPGRPSCWPGSTSPRRRPAR